MAHQRRTRGLAAPPPHPVLRTPFFRKGRREAGEKRYTLHCLAARQMATISAETNSCFATPKRGRGRKKALIGGIAEWRRE